MCSTNGPATCTAVCAEARFANGIARTIKNVQTTICLPVLKLSLSGDPRRADINASLSTRQCQLFFHCWQNPRNSEIRCRSIMADMLT